MDSELELRAAICEAGRRLWQKGLVGGTEGNITARLSPRQFLSTPSGVSKGHMKPRDLLVVDAKGQTKDGGKASSEIAMHMRMYQHRPDCQAIVHAHPSTATGFSLCGEGIPDDVLPEAGYVLGSVALVPFSFPGTQEVPDNLEPYLADHKTFILSHHGAVTMGSTVYDALFRMETLERIAQTLMTAKLLGGARPMPDTAFDRLQEIAFNAKLD